MPTLTAATESRSTTLLLGMCLFSTAHATASASATYAPVIDAVRVPPSACRTSQSSTIVFSPSADTSMIARSDRPMRREISCVRPPTRPLTDSRSDRLHVARGSIEYSAVTQPSPDPFFQRGTPGVNEVTQSTLVPPNSTRTLPSPASRNPRVRVTGRSSSGARPSARTRAREDVDGAEVMARSLTARPDRPRRRPAHPPPERPGREARVRTSALVRPGTPRSADVAETVPGRPRWYALGPQEA